MSLGLGIFLSTLLLIIVWQVDKRGAWRKFGKVMLWILGISVLVGSAIGGYVWWDDQSSSRAGERKVAEERERIKSGELDQYWGVQLGMSRDEVLYLKGEPKARRPHEGDRGGEQWSWGGEDGEERHLVALDKDGRVWAVMCVGGSFGECESVVGLNTVNLESELIAVLGQPLHEPKLTDNGRKEIVYGGGNIRVRFTLERQHVRAIQVSLREGSERPDAE